MLRLEAETAGVPLERTSRLTSPPARSAGIATSPLIRLALCKRAPPIAAIRRVRARWSIRFLRPAIGREPLIEPIGAAPRAANLHAIGHGACFA